MVQNWTMIFICISMILISSFTFFKASMLDLRVPASQVLFESKAPTKVDLVNLMWCVFATGDPPLGKLAMDQNTTRGLCK